jgi:hypothetical protein
MVAEQIIETCLAKTEARQQEGAPGPADVAKLEAVIDCLSRR